ncbi:hypothetical protein D3C81_1239810 [compost metagenome]
MIHQAQDGQRFIQRDVAAFGQTGLQGPANSLGFISITLKGPVIADRLGLFPVDVQRSCGRVKEPRHVNLTVRPMDIRVVADRQSYGTIQGGGCPVPVSQQHGEVFVNPRFPEVCRALNALRIRTQHHGRERNRVDAGIQQCPAAKFRIEQSPGRIPPRIEAEIGFHQSNFANPSGRQPFPHTVNDRQEPRPHRFHQEQLAFARIGNQLFKLRGIDRKRLLAKDRFPCPQRGHDVVLVVRMRCGYINGVHLRVSHQLLIASIRLGNPELLGKRLGFLQVSRPDGIRFAVTGGCQVPRKRLGNPAGRHDSPLDCRLSH